MIELQGANYRVAEDRHAGSSSGWAGSAAGKPALPWQGYLLSRPRLNQAVEKLRFGGVVSIVAGPGCGKTALIVDLLRKNDGPSSYYCLEEQDREPDGFLRGLVAAVRQVDPGAAEEGLELIEASTDVPRDCIGIARSIADGLGRSSASRDQPSRPVMLALDDLQIIRDQERVWGCLHAFLEGLPVGWVLLLASRQPLPLRERRLLAQGRRLHIEGRRLRLTPSEVQAWATSAWGVALSLADARAVWRLTEGWPVALVLMGEKLRGVGHHGDRGRLMAMLRKGADLRQYLESEVLHSLDERVSGVLMAAWPLPRVVFPRDAELLPSSSEEVLQDLAARGFFVTKTGHRLFTLHPLVRAYAERELLRRDEAAARDLLRASAAHLEKAGAHREAASLYLRVGDVEKAVGPIRALVMRSLNAASPSFEAEWLELLPEDAVAHEPWLLMLRARLLLARGRYDQACDLYRTSTRLFHAQGDSVGQLHGLLGQALCQYVLGRWEESLGSLAGAERLAHTREQRAEVLCNSASVLLALCRWDEAVERLETALAQIEPENRPVLEARVDVYRARLFFLRGLYVTGARWAQRAVRKSSSIGHELYATALNASATLLVQLGQYEEGLVQAEAALAMVRARSWTFMEGPVTLCVAGAHLGLGRVRSGITLAKQALELSRSAQDAEAEVWAEDLLGDVCRRNRNPRKAMIHHERAIELSRQHGLSAYELARSTCGLGMDLAVVGDGDEALRCLSQAIASARKHGLTSVLAGGRLYEGWLQAVRGQERAARASLGEAVRLVEEGGYVHFLLQEASVALPIYALCERYGLAEFLRSRVVPQLPPRQRRRYEELSRGGVYPTDVRLGFAGHATERRAVDQDPGATCNPDQEDAAAKVRQLTDREMEILRMVGLGLPNKLIASKLFIAEKTVKTHTNRMFRKLGVTNRLQAVLAFQAYQRQERQAGAGRSGRGL